MKTRSCLIDATAAELKVNGQLPENQLREPRWACQTNFFFWQGTFKVKCTMININSGGAGFSGVYTVSSGTKTEVRLKDDSIAAEVIWVIGDRCGMQFSRRLTIDETCALRNGGIH